MEYYISSIMGWGPTWAPRNWAICAGQLLPISNNTAVFSLVGTLYGGNGQTTFGLPDLRGRTPIGAGQGGGTSHYEQGAKYGYETRTLTVLEMPAHTHTASSDLTSTVSASTSNGSSNTPSTSNVPAKGFVAKQGPGVGDATEIYADASEADTTLHGGPVSGNIQIGQAGGNQPFSVVQPAQAIQFIFCLQGIFPSRN